MKQVLRKGFSEVIVEEIPSPALRKGTVLVAPAYSLISSGTESSDLHTQGIVREVLERPSQLKALGAVAASYGVIPTIREALGKFRIVEHLIHISGSNRGRKSVGISLSSRSP